MKVFLVFRICVWLLFIGKGVVSFLFASSAIHRLSMNSRIHHGSIISSSTHPCRDGRMALSMSKRAAPSKISVLLLQDDALYGKKGDVVQINPTLFLNLWDKQGIAKRVNEDEVLALKSQKEESLKYRKERINSITASLCELVGGKRLVVVRKAGPTGKLFGTISTGDILSLALQSVNCTSRGIEQLGSIRVLSVSVIRLNSSDNSPLQPTFQPEKLSGPKNNSVSSLSLDLDSVADCSGGKDSIVIEDLIESSPNISEESLEIRQVGMYKVVIYLDPTHSASFEVEVVPAR